MALGKPPGSLSLDPTNHRGLDRGIGRVFGAIGSKLTIFFAGSRDGHQPHIRGLHSYYKDSPLKVG